MDGSIYTPERAMAPTKNLQIPLAFVNWSPYPNITLQIQLNVWLTAHGLLYKLISHILSISIISDFR